MWTTQPLSSLNNIKCISEQNKWGNEIEARLVSACFYDRITKQKGTLNSASLNGSERVNIGVSKW